jgi:hypothetical protein
MIASVVLVTLGLAAYSYVVWRDDPHKQQIGRQDT